MFNLTNDAVVAGQNLTWTVMGAAVALFYLFRCLSGRLSGDAYWLALGVIFVGGGSALHRFYWLFARAYRESDPKMWEWFADNAAWGLAPVVICIVVGYGCHLMPLFRNKIAGAGFLFGCALALWLIGVQLG